MIELKMLSLYDRYSNWIRSALTPDDVEYIMGCLAEDEYIRALSDEECAQLREMAENVTASLLGQDEDVW